MMKRLLSCFVSVSLLLATMPLSVFAEETALITENHVTEEAAIDKTEDTTTYELSNGANMTVFHGEDVRFENEQGILVDYNPELVEIEDAKSLNGNSLDDYAFENEEGDSKQYIPEMLGEETPVLMEKDNLEMAISFSDDTVKDLGLNNEKVNLKEDKVSDAYEQEKNADVDAVYGDAENGFASAVYTSLSKGVKETIVLSEAPENNIFTYKLRLKGCYPVKDELTGYITFYDEKTDEITGYIEPPSMNDKTGNAYSEDIDLEITRDDESSENNSYEEQDDESIDALEENEEYTSEDVNHSQ